MYAPTLHKNMKVLIVTNTAVENEAVVKVWNGILKRDFTIGGFPSYVGKVDDINIIYIPLGGAVNGISQLLYEINPNMILIAGELKGRCDRTKCGDIIIATELFTFIDGKSKGCPTTHDMIANIDVFRYIIDDSKDVEVHQGPVELSDILPNRDSKDWDNFGEASARSDVIGVDIGTTNIYDLNRLHHEMYSLKISYLLIKGVSDDGTQLEGVNEQYLKRIAAERSADWILQFCRETVSYFNY